MSEMHPRQMELLRSSEVSRDSYYHPENPFTCRAECAQGNGRRSICTARLPLLTTDLSMQRESALRTSVLYCLFDPSNSPGDLITAPRH
jgi:hypothetical protein